MVRKKIVLTAFFLLSASHLVMASESTQLESGHTQTSQTKLPGAGEFPNYFEYIDKSERLDLVARSFDDILSSLEIPHLMEPTGSLEYDNFFNKIVGLAQQQDADAKVYVAGGMVRSLLGFDYKKLSKAVERSLSKKREKDDKVEPIKAIINKSLTSLSNRHSKKRRHYLKTLGVSSDFDILIDFSESTASTVKSTVIKSITNFINSAEAFLGLKKDQSKIKKSVVPVGDVKDYQEQIGTKGVRSAVTQGGLTLDWLAYDLVAKKIRFPEGHENILDEFFQGRLNYLKAKNAGPTPDKQTMRALRPLLEIPFTRYDDESEQILAGELQDLSERGFFSTGAEEQVEKMIRNAVEGSRYNFLAKPGRGDVNPHIRQAAKKMSDKFKSKNTSILPPAAEFLEKRNIQSRNEDKGGLKASNILMPVDAFITKYTEKGMVQHGTPNLVNVLNMMRNGFLLSKSDQGTAAFGSGFYAAKEASTAQTYAKAEGIVVPIEIKAHENLRILDVSSINSKGFITDVQRLYPKQDLNEVLANEYDIDIIINSYILVQNAAALKLPKDIKLLIQAQIDQTKQDMQNKLKVAIGFSTLENSIGKWMQHLHPKRGFSQLLILLGGQSSKSDLAELEAYLDKEIQKDNAHAAHILLAHQGAFAASDAARTLVDAYLSKNKSEKFPANFTPKWYALQDEQNLSDIGLDDLINSFKTAFKAPRSYKATALQKAIIAGSIDAVNLLLSAGAALDSIDVNGYTVVQIAAQQNQLEILRVLADAGVKLDVKNDNGETPLSTAAAYGNLEAMTFLLSKGADINSKNNEGRSILCKATINGELDAAKLLVGAGADKFAKDNNGLTVFAHAISYGKTVLAEYLSSIGVGAISEKDIYGNSLLALASFNGKINAVKYLHSKGLKIADANNNGSTPLSLAAKRGHYAVIEYLLDNKANINLQDKDGCTPLEEAVTYGHLPAVKVLLEKGAERHTKNNAGETLLVVAAKRNQAHIVEYLVEQGLDVNVNIIDDQDLLNPRGESLVIWAARQDRHRLVQLLLEKGADFHTQFKTKQSLLNWAVEKGNAYVFETIRKLGKKISEDNNYINDLLQLAMKKYNPNFEIIQTLIENGGDVQIKNRDGKSLLYLAISNGKIEFAKSLVSKGSSLEEMDQYGATLMHLAARSSSHESLKFLVESGLDPKRADKFGNTPYMGALNYKESESIRYLESIQADIVTPGAPAANLFKHALDKENYELMTVLISRGVSLNVLTPYDPLLFGPVGSGNLKLVKFLVEAGADIKLKGQMNETSLHEAAAQGKLEVVQFLIENGLNVNESDTLQNTPLYKAAGIYSNVETFKYLLMMGADVSVKDFQGKTVLQNCVEIDNFEAFKALIDYGVDIKFKDENNNGILNIAASKASLKILKWLIDQGVDLEDTNDNGETALMLAYINGKAEAVQMLLDAGAKLDAIDKLGCNLLLRAVKSGKVNDVESLLGKGFSIESRDLEGTSAFALACINEIIAVAELLLEKGALFDVRDHEGNTLLGLAASKSYGGVKMLNYLLEKNADPNAKNNSGRTPVSFAAERGNLDKVKTLVAKGADLNSADNEGLTPLYFAAIGGKTELTEYLLSQNDLSSLTAKEQAALLILACKQAHKERILEWVKKGILINSQDANGRTPVSHVIQSGTLEMLEFLESQRADLTIADNSGKKPADYAFENLSDLGVAKNLMARGFNFDFQSQNADLFLIKAIAKQEVELVKQLLDKGVNKNGVDSLGYTPLSMAVAMNDVNTVQLFLDLDVDLTPIVLGRGTALEMAKTIQKDIHNSDQEAKAYMLQHENKLYATPDDQTPKPILRLRALAEIEKLLVAKGAK